MNNSNRQRRKSKQKALERIGIKDPREEEDLEISQIIQEGNRGMEQFNNVMNDLSLNNNNNQVYGS